jgi:hypothetical protein
MRGIFEQSALKIRARDQRLTACRFERRRPLELLRKLRGRCAAHDLSSLRLINAGFTAKTISIFVECESFSVLSWPWSRSKREWRREWLQGNLR